MPEICIFAFDPQQVFYRNKDITSSVFGRKNCQGFCFRKINGRPKWFCRVRSPSLDCGLGVGVLCRVNCQLYHSSMFVTPNKALEFFAPLSLHLKSGTILAAYLTSNGSVRISQLKFVKCLEINEGKNLYECKVLLPFPSVFLFSVSFEGLLSGETW